VAPLKRECEMGEMGDCFEDVAQFGPLLRQIELAVD
jgi:hypothetical protein